MLEIQNNIILFHTRSPIHLRLCVPLSNCGGAGVSNAARCSCPSGCVRLDLQLGITAGARCPRPIRGELAKRLASSRPGQCTQMPCAERTAHSGRYCIRMRKLAGWDRTSGCHCMRWQGAGASMRRVVVFVYSNFHCDSLATLSFYTLLGLVMEGREVAFHCTTQYFKLIASERTLRGGYSSA